MSMEEFNFATMSGLEFSSSKDSIMRIPNQNDTKTLCRREKVSNLAGFE